MFVVLASSVVVALASFCLYGWGPNYLFGLCLQPLMEQGHFLTKSSASINLQLLIYIEQFLLGVGPGRQLIFAIHHFADVHFMRLVNYCQICSSVQQPRGPPTICLTTASAKLD